MKLLLALLFAAPLFGPLALGTLAVERAREALHPAVPFGSSTWNGSYTCRQGLTHLSLTVERAAGSDDVDAFFVFDALEENPRLPSGSFRMHGAVDAGHVVLKPRSWIVRPSGWLTVGLTGDVDENRFTGVVDAGASTDCTTFALTRAPQNRVVANEVVPLGSSHWRGNTACARSLEAEVLELAIDQAGPTQHELTATMSMRRLASGPSSIPTTIELAGHVDVDSGRFVLAPSTFVTEGRGAELVGLNGVFGPDGAVTATLRPADRVALPDELAGGDDDGRCDRVVLVRDR